MGFRFQKRIKIAPGFYLNMSKRGLSTSARVGNVTLNSRGGVSASIPGTGISYRTRLQSAGSSSSEVVPFEPTEVQPSSPGTKRIAAGIVCCLLGAAVPVVSLLAIPMFVSGYEARYR